MLGISRHLRAWLRSPFSVGALVPSSRFLAAAMVGQIDVATPGIIVELGAGTGVVTQALMDIGIAPERLLILERDARLHRLLRKHFSHLNVVCADAARLDEILAGAPVAAIVSSLPLLSLPRALQTAIEQRMAEAIGRHGRIIQFTYGPQSPLSEQTRHRYGLAGKRVKTVLANIPPAHVWVYQPSTTY